VAARSAATPGRLGRPVPLRTSLFSGKLEGRRSPTSPQETFRGLGGGDTFPGSRQFPYHLILPHGIPGLASGVTSCLFSTYARISWRQTQVCLRPLICFGQTRASRPPPLQHRVPTRAASKFDFSKLRASVSLVRIAPGPFQSQVDQPLGTGTRPGLTTAPFQPRGILDVRMSLSTFFFNVDVARQRF